MRTHTASAADCSALPTAAGHRRGGIQGGSLRVRSGAGAASSSTSAGRRKAPLRLDRRVVWTAEVGDTQQATGGRGPIRPLV